MKVTIEITPEGYTKTLAMSDGTQHIEKWERINGGFTATDGSAKYDDLGLTDDLIEALGDIDFSMSDISNALETESSELPWDFEDAITNDGHKLQRGDRFYSVATVAGTWESVPIRNKYPQDWDICGTITYYDFEKCQAQCEKYNLAELNNRKINS